MTRRRVTWNRGALQHRPKDLQLALQPRPRDLQSPALQLRPREGSDHDWYRESDRRYIRGGGHRGNKIKRKNEVN